MWMNRKKELVGKLLRRILQANSKMLNPIIKLIAGVAMAFQFSTDSMTYHWALQYHAATVYVQTK